MPSRNKHYAEPVTNGSPEMKLSKAQDEAEGCINALAAVRLSETRTNNSTTLSPLSECPECHNRLGNMPGVYSPSLPGGKSSAPPVTMTSPSEKASFAEGVKYDDTKPALAYIPKAALYAEGEAFAYGAKKYEAWNYKNGLAVTRTLSAALRHIVQFLEGEDLDQESGVNHLGCARANLAMALDSLVNHPEFDDRHKGGKK